MGFDVAVVGSEEVWAFVSLPPWGPTRVSARSPWSSRKAQLSCCAREREGGPKEPQCSPCDKVCDSWERWCHRYGFPPFWSTLLCYFFSKVNSFLPSLVFFYEICSLCNPDRHPVAPLSYHLPQLCSLPHSRLPPYIAIENLFSNESPLNINE